MAGLALFEAILAGLILTGSMVSISQTSYTSSLAYGRASMDQRNAIFDVAALLYGNSTARSCVGNSPCSTELLGWINTQYSLEYSSISGGNATAYAGKLGSCTRSSYECIPANQTAYCIYVCS